MVQENIIRLKVKFNDNPMVEKQHHQIKLFSGWKGALLFPTQGNQSVWEEIGFIHWSAARLEIKVLLMGS